MCNFYFLYFFNSKVKYFLIRELKHPTLNFLSVWIINFYYYYFWLFISFAWQTSCFSGACWFLSYIYIYQIKKKQDTVKHFYIYIYLLDTHTESNDLPRWPGKIKFWFVHDRIETHHEQTDPDKLYDIIFFIHQFNSGWSSLMLFF